MSMGKGEDYVSFEATSHALAQERLVQDARALSVHPNEMWKLEHILASAFCEGMVYGGALAQVYVGETTAALEIFNAGVCEGFDRGDEVGYRRALDDVNRLGGAI